MADPSRDPALPRPGHPPTVRREHERHRPSSAPRRHESELDRLQPRARVYRGALSSASSDVVVGPSGAGWKRRRSGSGSSRPAANPRPGASKPAASAIAATRPHEHRDAPRIRPRILGPGASALGDDELEPAVELALNRHDLGSNWVPAQRSARARVHGSRPGNAAWSARRRRPRRRGCALRADLPAGLRAGTVASSAHGVEHQVETGSTRGSRHPVAVWEALAEAARPVTGPSC